MPLRRFAHARAGRRRSARDRLRSKLGGVEPKSLEIVEAGPSSRRTRTRSRRARRFAAVSWPCGPASTSPPVLSVYLPVLRFCEVAAARERRRAILAALRAEMEAHASEPAETIFSAAARRTHTRPSRSRDFSRPARALPAPDASVEREICLEVNPELVRPGDFERYRGAGVTRISIGVQSFEPSRSRRSGASTFPRRARVVESARSAGIPSLSIDLMFGFPGRRRVVARRSRSGDRARRGSRVHVRAHVEAGTPYAAWQAREPGAFLDADREAISRCGDRFARSGRLRALRNQQFRPAGAPLPAQRELLENGEYIGLASARRPTGAAWLGATRSLEVYLEAAAAGEQSREMRNA